MTEEESLRLVVRVVALSAIVAFHPQILRALRRIGYRDEHETNTVKWKRGAALFGIALILFVVGLML